MDALFARCNGEKDTRGIRRSGTMPTPVSAELDGKYRLMQSLSIKRIGEHTYSSTTNYADIDRLTATHEKYGGTSGGACSSFMAGNLQCRSFDWYYDDLAYFLVRIPSSPKVKHASIAMCSPEDVTDGMVQSLEWSDSYTFFGARALDGINDAGFCCNANVVPTDNPDDHSKKNVTTGTAPGKRRLCALGVVRYLLDNADDVDSAITLLGDVDIFSPIGLIDEEYHWMLSDPSKTVVVEIVNNSIVVISQNSSIMTNFHLKGFDGDLSNICLETCEDDLIAKNTTVTPHAMGLERYAIIADGISSVSDVAGAEALLESIAYTELYDDSVSPYWYGELYKDDVTFANASKSDFSELIPVLVSFFENRSRKTGLTWHSAHQAVYDLDNLKVFYKFQQTGEWLEFSL